MGRKLTKTQKENQERARRRKKKLEAKGLSEKQIAAVEASKRTARFNFLATPALAARIEAAAAEIGKPVSVWVREAVELVLEDGS